MFYKIVQPPIWGATGSTVSFYYKLISVFAGESIFKPISLVKFTTYISAHNVYIVNHCITD